MTPTVKGWEDDNRPRRFAQYHGIKFCLLQKRYLTPVMERTIIDLWMSSTRVCPDASRLSFCDNVLLNFAEVHPLPQPNVPRHEVAASFGFQGVDDEPRLTVGG